MEVARPGGDSAWESLEAACRRQFPERDVGELARKLEEGFALVGELNLEAALRTVSGEGPAPPPPTGPDRSAFVRWIVERLRTFSMEDGLTGLFNRRYFDHRVRQELQRATRDGRPLAVLIVDADNFKRINDRHGHATGDLVLQTLGQVMRDVLRMTDDVTTRFGGEEFAAILPATDARGAVIAAERLRASVESHPFDFGGHHIPVTVSVGISCFDPSWAKVTVEQLIEEADGALYQAKDEGRNRVRLHGQLLEATITGLTSAEKDALLR